MSVVLWLLLVVAAVSLLLTVLGLATVLEAALLWRVPAALLLLATGVVWCWWSAITLIWLLLSITARACLLITSSIALSLWWVVGVIAAVLLTSVVLLAVVLLVIALLAVATLVVVRTARHDCFCFSRDAFCV